MRTKVLLIVDMYYISFIIIATLLTLVRGDTNLALLSYMPILFLIHGNITDAILLLILFSNSISAIFYIVWLWFYVPINLLFNKYIIVLYTFRPPINLDGCINKIFHPPINIYL